MKSWIEICLRNKLTILVLAFAICLAGIATLVTTGIAPFPSMTSKSIGLQFSYPGANAQTVETQITSKVVDAVRSLNNIQRVTAISKPGGAYLNLRLNNNDTNNMLQSEMKVIQAIDSSHLPSIVPQPQIYTAATTSGMLDFVLLSKKLSPFQLSNLLASKLTPKMQSIPNIFTNGTDKHPVIRVALKPQKLAEYHLDASAIAQKLNQIFHASPLGELYFNKISYTLNADNPIQSVKDWQNLVIGYQGKSLGRPIYLKDIASVNFESRNIISNQYFSQDGMPGAALYLETHALANPIKVSKTAREYIHSFKEKLGSLAKIIINFDQGTVMREAIHDVLITLVVTAFLVMLVALVFLGRIKTTLIPIMTIPICLLGTLVGLQIIGYTPNLLTLLAMVISIGLVVDDAIVVVENITRYIENGYSKKEAVITATSRIGKTVIGITATLLAVYTPILFSSWDMAIIFKAFAVALAIAVFLSGLVALTLTPVMAMALIPDGVSTYQKHFDAYLNRFIFFYQKGLKHCLRHPWIALLIILLLLVVVGSFATKVPIKVFPQDYQGTASVHIKGGPQDTVKTLKAETQLFSGFYHSHEVKNYGLSIEPDQKTGILTADLHFQLKPQFIKKSGAFAEKLTGFIDHHKLKNATARAANFSNWGGNFDLSFYLYGNTLKSVNQNAIELTRLMKQSPIFSKVENEIQQPKRSLQFDINSVLAAKYGLYRNDISNFLSTYYGGYQLQNNFSIDGLSIPVVVQLGKANLQSELSLEKLTIHSPLTGKSYPISQFVKIKTVAKPAIINTFNNKPSVALNANLKPDESLSTAISNVDQLIQTHMPDMQHYYFGNAQEYIEGSSASTMIMISGILCIYLILALLFKSILDPFIIMLTVPFSVLGGILTLYVFGASINIYSALGLITLIGLITKHGVLIVQFANSELEKGEEALKAIITATHHRFRPIVMTTLAMVLGVLPLAISSGEMYGSRFNLSITIIGGLLIGTLFSLFIVPVVYLLISRLRIWGAGDS